MFAYQTDYTGDGRFVGAIEADTDPMEEGKFLIPAGAVTEPPPEAEAPSYARWVGGAWEIYTPAQPEPEPEPGPPTVGDYKVAIVALLDTTAQARLYDSALSISTYVTSTNPVWAAEALTFVAWRDAVWAYAYTELDKVLGGRRAQPTVAELLGELPAIVWP